MQEPGGPPPRGDAWLLGGAAAVTVLLGGTVVALSVLGGPEEPARIAQPTVQVEPPQPTIETPEPETPTPETPEPTPESVRATVNGTCGRGGVGGDCRLSVRAEPSSAADEIDRLEEGDRVEIVCQVRGERVTSSALGGSSTVWSSTTDGGYVANAYLDGPGLNPRRITLPRC